MTLPLALGDVIVRLRAQQQQPRDEVWLAGALVFEEDRPIGALFVAPEAGGDRAVFVRADRAGSPMAWLEPIADDVVPRSADPPHVIEHAGLRFERVRRIPVRVRRIGSGAPDVGSSAIVAEYAGVAAGSRIVVVAGSEARFAWRGVDLLDGQYEILRG